MAAPFLTDVRAVWLTSKGFAPDGSGRAQLLPQVMEEVLVQEKTRVPPIVAIGGPCKANEVASRHPTAPILAAAERADEADRRRTDRGGRASRHTRPRLLHHRDQGHRLRPGRACRRPGPP